MLISLRGLCLELGATEQRELTNGKDRKSTEEGQEAFVGKDTGDVYDFAQHIATVVMSINRV